MMTFRFSLKTVVALATTAVGVATASSHHHGIFDTKRFLDDASSDPAGNDASSLIVGGSDAAIGAYPYFVSLDISTNRGIFSCGGALIAPDVVLSAAHCSDGIGIVSGYTVLVGAYRRGSTTEGAVFRTCSEWINHPSYVNVTIDPSTGSQSFDSGNFVGNDFALCRLNETVAIDTTNVYLELNEDDTVPADKEGLTIMGFGTTDANRDPQTISDILQEVELPILNTSSCDQIIRNLSNQLLSITDTMLCAWDETEQTAECLGDSGGPLVSIETQSDGRSRHTLSGVSSFSTTICGQYPGIYGRVSAGIDFIQQQVCVNWGINAQFCPTDSPSRRPSSSPSASPTDSPSSRPTASPTERPSRSPTPSPTGFSSARPSKSTKKGKKKSKENTKTPKPSKDDKKKKTKTKAEKFVKD